MTGCRINLKENTCPNREQRARGINVYYGKASRIIEDARAGNLKHQERAFQQASGCLLNFYLSMRVSTIRDAVIIFHAPVGCSAAALGYRETFMAVPTALGRPEKLEFHWLTTNLNETDVVHGAGDKLKYAIEEAERRHSPKAIFIMASCTSGIIGEDLEGTVNEVQPDIKATIVPIHCEGIKSRIVQTGYDTFWHGVLKYLVNPPQQKQHDLVNLASMLSYTWQDRLELTRLLGKIGLRPNFVPELASVEQFEILAEAALTAPICPSYVEYLATGLEQEYGVPYFLYPGPIGVQNTDEWLRQIGAILGKEKQVEKLIGEEHDEWLPKLEAVQKEFKSINPDGEPIDILGSLGQGRLVTQTPYFHELGVKTSATICMDFDELVVDEVEKVVNEVGDFDILVNTFQASEIAHISKSRNPDIHLSCPFQGTAYKREKGMTRIHALRSDPRHWSAQAGYKGAVACGNFLLQSLKNKSYQRTMLAKTEPTYTDWFFERPSPIYLKEGVA